MRTWVRFSPTANFCLSRTCTKPYVFVHFMYVPGICMVWTSARHIRTQTYMEKQYVFEYTLYRQWPMNLGLTWNIHVCTCAVHCIYVFEHIMYMFNLVHHFLGIENASPCSARSMSRIYTVHTSLSRLHIMLVYTNLPFGTDTAEQRIYPLRMPVAGGQLSCAIS